MNPSRARRKWKCQKVQRCRNMIFQFNDRGAWKGQGTTGTYNFSKFQLDFSVKYNATRLDPFFTVLKKEVVLLICVCKVMYCLSNFKDIFHKNMPQLISKWSSSFSFSISKFQNASNEIKCILSMIWQQ